MRRLHKLIQAKKSAGDKCLSVFLPAGFPRADSTPRLVMGMQEAGVDFIELGIPFSDPIADGPVIQEASQIALRNGTTVERCFGIIDEIRRQSDLPIVLMGYFNPLLHFGIDNALRRAQACGVDGFIIPDLLPEEYLRFQPHFQGGPGVNFLVSPNTNSERLRRIDALTDSFVYCVSVKGTTGARTGVAAGLEDYLRRVRRNVRHAFMVGFGISTPEDAAAISRLSDGVIVGSAVIKMLLQKPGAAGISGAIELVARIRQATKTETNILGR